VSAATLAVSAAQVVATGPLIASTIALRTKTLLELEQKLKDAGVPAGQRDEIRDDLSKRAGAAFDRGAKEVEAALASATPKQSVKDLVTRWRIDRYFEAANISYDVGGKSVQARPFFRITGGHNGDAEKIKSRLAKETGRRDKIFSAAAHKAAYGRATPAQIKLLTDVLIQKGKLDDIRHQHPGLDEGDLVKKLQWEYGIGMDCAGYTQQAFLAVHGGSRKQYGFDPKIGNENLYDLKGNKAFKKVSPENARAGDLLILGPPPDDDAGHTVLIRDRREASFAERAAWSDPSSFASASDQVHVVEVDSSFGAGPSGALDTGGVQRRTWLYNESTKKWAAVESGRIVPSTDTGPYDHPMQGIYQPK
jgi:hypothetical protein